MNAGLEDSDRAVDAQRLVYRLLRPYLTSMIDDREIWACANQLIKQHGADAWFAAAQRADELYADGKLDGHRTYVRILSRMKQLEQMAPAGSVH